MSAERCTPAFYHAQMQTVASQIHCRGNCVATRRRRARSCRMRGGQTCRRMTTTGQQCQKRVTAPLQKGVPLAAWSGARACCGSSTLMQYFVDQPSDQRALEISSQLWQVLSSLGEELLPVNLMSGTSAVGFDAFQTCGTYEPLNDSIHVLLTSSSSFTTVITICAVALVLVLRQGSQLSQGCIQEVSACLFAAWAAIMLALMRKVLEMSQATVGLVCTGLTFLLHVAYLAQLIAQAAGHDVWALTEHAISPVTSYATLVVVSDFMLAPYWFTNVEAVLTTLRAMCMVAAVAYMLHVSILELFASPTEGLLRALSLGVRAEKELYIAQVAHDIGTPLTTFSLGLQLLREDPDVTPEMLQVLEMQTLALDAMKVIRQQALDAAAFSNGHNPVPSLATGSIRALTRRCMQILSVDLGTRGAQRKRHSDYMASAAADAVASVAVLIEWEWHVEEAVSHVIQTDFSWVQDMLLQLLYNAKKHATGTLRVLTTVTLQDGKWLRFTVRDYGQGVSQDYAEALFEKFTLSVTAKNPHRSPQGGLGLGLFSLSVKARALGGDYGVNCWPQIPTNPSAGSGRGAEFWFTIPYQPCQGDVADRLSQMGGTPGVTGRESRVHTQGTSASSTSTSSRSPHPVTSVATRDTLRRHLAFWGGHAAPGVILQSEYESSSHRVFGGAVMHQISIPAACSWHDTHARRHEATSSTASSRLDAGSSHSSGDRRCALPSAASTGGSSESGALSSSTGKRPLVLVVDDEGSIRKFLDRMLDQRGYRVVLACNGVEGLGAMKTCAFHADWCCCNGCTGPLAKSPTCRPQQAAIRCTRVHGGNRNSCVTRSRSRNTAKRMATPAATCLLNASGNSSAHGLRSHTDRPPVLWRGALDVIGATQPANITASCPLLAKLNFTP
ncbi:hypothetical protein JKP88DRAFT_253468 [Tribonema minus]|uniref:Histidine kinase domain-containing protein n=1 Tax=Tribonema minus TaxID=303371 RepID=A0A835ZDP5_9STRA|nr:hypothetical protein JKP88DRAFT_253468 [Tribonema minus]